MTAPSFPTPDHIRWAQASANRVYSVTGFYRWPSVALAQAIIESAGWTKLSGRNNGLGIKDFRPGHGTSRTTHETINGQDRIVSQPFADFESAEACYDSHAWLFWNAKWRDGTKIYADALAAPNAETFARLISEHYATSPIYRDTLLHVLSSRNLYQYDQAPADRVAAPGPSQRQASPAPVTLWSRIRAWFARL